jgi:hypothetical protein
MDCRQTGNRDACAARPCTFVGRGEVHTLQRFFEKMLSGMLTSTVSNLPFSSGSIKTELEALSADAVMQAKQMLLRSVLDAIASTTPQNAVSTVFAIARLFNEKGTSLQTLTNS